MEVPLTESSQVLKYKRALKACIPCRNAKVGCDHQRPCFRCTKHGIQKSCVDAPRRPRSGKKPKASKEQDNGVVQPIIPNDVQEATLIATPDQSLEYGFGLMGQQLQQQLMGQQLQQQLAQQQQSTQQFQIIHQQLMQQQQQQQLQQSQLQQSRLQQQFNGPPLGPQQSLVQSVLQSQNSSQDLTSNYVPTSPTVFFAQLLNDITNESAPDSNELGSNAGSPLPIGASQLDIPSQSSPSVDDASSEPVNYMEHGISSPANDLTSANKRIESLAAQITKMSIHMEQLMLAANTTPKLPQFPNNPLPSYLDTTHPLNSDTTPMAVWQAQDKLLVDCNIHFATLLGYNSVPHLLFGVGVTTLIGGARGGRLILEFQDIMGPTLREKAMQTCREAIVKKVSYQAPHLVTRIETLDPVISSAILPFPKNKITPFSTPSTPSFIPSTPSPLSFPSFASSDSPLSSSGSSSPLSSSSPPSPFQPSATP